MNNLPFNKCIFINCPFDDDYEPILQSILFCIIFLGFHPRLSLERNDGGENRLRKITELIEGSQYSIHDLSRCQATKKGEHFRLNMPLELGIDYGCKQYFGQGREEKKFLILEEKRYRYQTTISDLSGCDIQHHDANFEKAVRKVRNWLSTIDDGQTVGAQKILNAYAYFQEWHYERQLDAGFSEEDIQDYLTAELLAAMKTWMREGQPI